MTREGYQIARRDKLENCLVELHALLDMCYPMPPRDVFYRLTEQYRPGFPAWFARDERNQLVGFVYLAPNSKGGTLETLAVHPDYSRLGIAKDLVKELLEATHGVISLTTRIPKFFVLLGFQRVCSLPDESVFMFQLRSDPRIAIQPGERDA